MRHLTFVALIGLSGAAHAAAPSVALRMDGGEAQRIDGTALAALPQQTVHASAHGKEVTCSGPNLIDVLEKAGAPRGEKLRGKNLEYVVRVSAADGYRVAFALAELDPGMRDAVPILTASCDGAPLDDKEGPLRVIVPGEKRPARWIRQVNAIDVLKMP